MEHRDVIIQKAECIFDKGKCKNKKNITAEKV
jgi:hypothetical protein